MMKMIDNNNKIQVDKAIDRSQIRLTFPEVGAAGGMPAEKEATLVGP